ncbi:hypothetical protein FQN50_001260 [Emmonsiellopsis sp. PD_5]|nr:hypothetical protein FQN50_001260 [Emmonsiellopsis sp. PD_5]
MKGVTWEGKTFEVAVKHHPKPKIEDPLDVIIRTTISAICGTDLHTYHGGMGSSDAPWIIGHEGVGIIEEVGAGVHSLKCGDKVVVSSMLACGFCENCVRGRLSYCLTLNPPHEGAVLGFGGELGPPRIGGAQAEYLRVPFADTNCVLLPPEPTHDLDYVTVADIWPAGWSGLDFAGFKPGDSVAVFGAGPVGLMCAYSAILRGARAVYSIDHVPARLRQAEGLGAIPINFHNNDPVAEILKLEPGGVARSVDCVGYECLNSQLKREESIVLTWCIRVTEPTGGIGVVGVYLPPFPKSEGVPNADVDGSVFPLPIGEAWFKGLRISSGIAEFRKLQIFMRELIISGKATPGMVITTEINIDDAPEAYRKFSDKQVVIRFDKPVPSSA